MNAWWRCSAGLELERVGLCSCLSLLTSVMLSLDKNELESVLLTPEVIRGFTPVMVPELPVPPRPPPLPEVAPPPFESEPADPAGEPEEPGGIRREAEEEPREEDWPRATGAEAAEADIIPAASAEEAEREEEGEGGGREEEEKEEEEKEEEEKEEEEKEEEEESTGGGFGSSLKENLGPRFSSIC